MQIFILQFHQILRPLNVFAIHMKISIFVWLNCKLWRITLTMVHCRSEPTWRLNKAMKREKVVEQFSSPEDEFWLCRLDTTLNPRLVQLKIQPRIDGELAILHEILQIQTIKDCRMIVSVSISMISVQTRNSQECQLQKLEVSAIKWNEMKYGTVEKSESLSRSQSLWHWQLVTSIIDFQWVENRSTWWWWNVKKYGSIIFCNFSRIQRYKRCL